MSKFYEISSFGANYFADSHYLFNLIANYFDLIRKYLNNRSVSLFYWIYIC